MSCWVLIPLKAREQAKRRLAAALSPPERLRLVERMFEHVVDTLRRTDCIDGIAVTSPEPVGHDVLWLADRAGELNAALADGAAELAQRGWTELVVLHADLPRQTVADVEMLITEGRRRGMALAPDHHGRGTNALYTMLPGPVEYQFGQGSLERHLESAKRSGMTPALVRRPGLACDVDVPGDLRHLAWMRGGQEFLDHAAGAEREDCHLASC